MLSFKHTDQEVVDFYARASDGPPLPGVPKLDSRRMVDGQRQIFILKNIPATSAGSEFELRGKVIGVYDKGKAGTVTEFEHELVEKKSGEVYTRIVSSSFAVGQGGWGGPSGMCLLSAKMRLLTTTRSQGRQLPAAGGQEARCFVCLHHQPVPGAALPPQWRL